MVPALGNVADLANAAVSVARGDAAGAALSLAAAVPGAGLAAGAAKIGKKATKMPGSGCRDFGLQSPHEKLQTPRREFGSRYGESFQVGSRYDIDLDRRLVGDVPVETARCE